MSLQYVLHDLNSICILYHDARPRVPDLVVCRETQAQPEVPSAGGDLPVEAPHGAAGAV